MSAGFPCDNEQRLGRIAEATFCAGHEIDFAALNAWRASRTIIACAYQTSTSAARPTAAASPAGDSPICRAALLQVNPGEA
jgi:hypothetical protein